MEVIDLRNIKPPDEISPLTRALLFPVLAPLSAVYGGAMRLWRRLPARPVDHGIPVVSIGSLSVGGTGKTPLCMLVAGRFAESGRKPCIISRGYRRREKQSPLLVSDGQKILASVEAAGDEPFMMARRLKGTGVVVGRDRAEAALEARRRVDPAVLVLDDGFQCRSLVKRAEIVCLDRKALDPGAALLPLGALREGWWAIDLADLIVIVLNPGDREPPPGRLARLGESKVFVAERRRPSFVDSGGNPVGRDEIGRQRTLLLSGIARPAGFERGCLAEGVNVVASLRYEDHHWYGDKDVERVTALMRKHSCSRLVTTEKDLVKLPPELGGLASALRTDLVLRDEGVFWKALDDLMGG